jgi:IS1 family transposase
MRLSKPTEDSSMCNISPLIDGAAVKETLKSKGVDCRKTAKTRFTGRLKRSIQAFMHADYWTAAPTETLCMYSLTTSAIRSHERKMHAHFAKLQREIECVD